MRRKLIIKVENKKSLIEIIDEEIDSILNEEGFLSHLGNKLDKIRSAQSWKADPETGEENPTLYWTKHYLKQYERKFKTSVKGPVFDLTLKMINLANKTCGVDQGIVELANELNKSVKIETHMSMGPEYKGYVKFKDTTKKHISRRSLDDLMVLHFNDEQHWNFTASKLFSQVMSAYTLAGYEPGEGTYRKPNWRIGNEIGYLFQLVNLLRTADIAGTFIHELAHMWDAATQGVAAGEEHFDKSRKFGQEHVETFATEQALLFFNCLEPVFFQKVDEIIPKISKMPKELVADQVKALKNVGSYLFGGLRTGEEMYHNRSINHSYTTSDAKEQEYHRDSTTGDDTMMPHSGEKWYERRPGPTRDAARDNFGKLKKNR